VCVLFLVQEKKSSLLFVCVRMCADSAIDSCFVFFVSSRASVSSEQGKLPHQRSKTPKKTAESTKNLLIGGVRLTSLARLLGRFYFSYTYVSGEKMAQRSPRKSLQLNRANTPINFSGPMQDVNVSGSFFIKKERAGSKTCARALFVKSLSFLQKRSLSRSRLQSCFFSRVKTSRY